MLEVKCLIKDFTNERTVPVKKAIKEMGLTLKRHSALVEACLLMRSGCQFRDENVVTPRMTAIFIVCLY